MSRGRLEEIWKLETTEMERVAENERTLRENVNNNRRTDTTARRQLHAIS